MSMEVEQQSALESDGARGLVQRHIAERHRFRITHTGTHVRAIAIITMEAASFHARAHRGVERPVCFFSHRHGEAHRLEEHRRHFHVNTARVTQAPQFAARIETRTHRLHAIEPGEGPLDGEIACAPRARTAIVSDHFDRDHRAHARSR
jgi:hypothetical protein